MKTERQFTAGQLKLLAMASMLSDHIAFIFLSDPASESLLAGGFYYAMRFFGRMAFPLYAFLLVEGFFHTGNRKRYALRLGILGIVSEIPFDLMVGRTALFLEAQNTLWLLLAGLLVMMAIDPAVQKLKEDTAAPESARAGLKETGRRAASAEASRRKAVIGTGLRIAIIMILGAAAAWFLRLDYGLWGFLLIMALYWFRGRPEYRMAAVGAVLMADYMDIQAFFAWFAFFFINRYNGEKGRNLGILPYLFYPAHIAVLVFIASYILHL